MNGLQSGIAAAASALDQIAPELTRLDSLQGDGDLGRTAGLIAQALRSALEEDDGDPSTVIHAAGTKIAKVAPSTSGTLVASGLLAAARALGEAQSEPAREAVSAAIAGIQRRGKAQPGDRTLIDPLVSVLSSLETHPGDLEAAAVAAEHGADATRTMTAKFGRARFLAANAPEEPDPGAVMVATAIAAGLRSAIT